MATFYDKGIYDSVEVVGQGYGESSKKKTPFFYLEILPGQYPRKMFWYLPHGKEDAVDRMLADLEALGFDTNRFERFSQLDPRSGQHVSFKGQMISCECRHKPGEANDGTLFEEWGVPYTPKPVEPADQKTVRQLDAMFGRKLGKRPAPAPRPVPAESLPQYADKPPVTSPEALKEVEGMDDIPF